MNKKERIKKNEKNGELERKQEKKMIHLGKEETWKKLRNGERKKKKINVKEKDKEE